MYEYEMWDFVMQRWLKWVWHVCCVPPPPHDAQCCAGISVKPNWFLFLFRNLSTGRGVYPPDVVSIHWTRCVHCTWCLLTAYALPVCLHACICLTAASWGAAWTPKHRAWLSACTCALHLPYCSYASARLHLPACALLSKMTIKSHLWVELQRLVWTVIT